MPLEHPAADVWTMLADWAEYAPEAPALLHGGRTISFAELLELSLRAARGLSDLGVGPGDRVALWLPNVPAYPILYLACIRLGAIAVAVNTRYRSVEVADIVGRSGAKVLACAPGFRHIDFLEILADIDPAALEKLTAIVVVGEEPGTPPPAIERLRASASTVCSRAPATASITPRSMRRATSSRPRARPARRNSSCTGRARSPAMPSRWRASSASPRPTRCRSRSCRCAASSASTRRWRPSPRADPACWSSPTGSRRSRGSSNVHRPTTMFGSDDMYARLLDLVPGERPFPSIRWAGYANFNAALANLAERAEPRGLRLVGLYGMSEVQALYARQPLDAPLARRKLGGGMPTSPLAHFRIEDGELQCAGPSLMVGYWGNEKATAETMTADGYVRTGDLAEADGHGGFTFLSRMGDVLRLSGFLVNPLEIEQHIQKMPGIEGCQTIALPRTDGVRAIAFVMLKPGATLDEAALISHCRSGLASYKVPVRVFAIEDFPKTPSPNGFKIQRGKLRELAEELMRT